MSQVRLRYRYMLPIFVHLCQVKASFPFNFDIAKLQSQTSGNISLLATSSSGIYQIKFSLFFLRCKELIFD